MRRASIESAPLVSGLAASAADAEGDGLICKASRAHCGPFSMGRLSAHALHRPVCRRGCRTGVSAANATLARIALRLAARLGTSGPAGALALPDGYAPRPLPPPARVIVRNPSQGSCGPNPLPTPRGRPLRWNPTLRRRVEAGCGCSGQAECAHNRSTDTGISQDA